MSRSSSPRSLAYWTNQVRSEPSLAAALTPRWTSAIPHRPTPKQAAFLLLDCREALFGGAAGGGKSEALLMAALQYVDQPDYAALLLRRRLTDASLPGALLDRTHEWLFDSSAVWSESDRTYTFPSGAKLAFGYLDHEGDRFRYQSSEFQFIGFDELTQFAEREYAYLFSRLRKREGSQIPLRMRSASNPGGPGHDWVRRRFLVEGVAAGRVFIPASVADNPHLDRQAYIESLQALDPKTRAQLLEGDWEAGDDGLLSFEDILACEAECLWPDGRAPKGRRPDLYVGIDVGRSRDLTVVWTWQRVGDVFWCRDLCVLDRATFREQKDAIRARLGYGVARAAIDKGGVGCQLAEELENEYRGVVEGVVMSAGVQGRLALRMAVAFGERRVRIPRDADLRSDLRLVRRPRGVGGVDRIETLRADVGHADRFWAAALALDAAASLERRYAAGPTSLPTSIGGTTRG